MSATRTSELVVDREGLTEQFPLPPELERVYSLAGRQAFLDAFLPVRDRIERDYYAEADRHTTPAARTQQFLGSMMNPILGKPMRDAEHFYQTFGRLMRTAWLSLSVGLYDDEIQAVSDVDRRLLLAQVNNVDTNWRPAISKIAANGGVGTIVEIGTGRGNSVVRLAMLLPNTRIVSITISPEQYTIVSQIVEEMRLDNVEVRLGNVLDPEATADLVGQADAVGAIEVVLHFQDAMKLEGMRRMTDTLKPGGVLCIIDSAIASPMSAFARQYYANQSIYFGMREDYFALFDQANLMPAAYVDYSPDMVQAFRETSVVLRKRRETLRQEFGGLMSWLWPEVPGRLYLQTLKNVRYVQAVGVKV